MTFNMQLERHLGKCVSVISDGVCYTGRLVEVKDNYIFLEDVSSSFQLLAKKGFISLCIDTLSIDAFGLKNKE